MSEGFMKISPRIKGEKSNKDMMNLLIPGYCRLAYKNIKNNNGMWNIWNFISGVYSTMGLIMRIRH